MTWNEPEKFGEWYEGDAAALIEELGRFDRVVTLNGIRFDLKVLSAYVWKSWKHSLPMGVERALYGPSHEKDRTVYVAWGA